MGIGGISPYAGLYQSYPARDIPQVDLTETDQKKTVSRPEEKTAGAAEESDRQPAAGGRTGKVDLENISLTFYPAGDGGTIGKDSDVLSLDMQKAISDMKKDRVLEDYQYFVGSSQEIKAVSAGADGTVIQKL